MKEKKFIYEKQFGLRNWINNSLSFKAVLVIMLIIVMLVPKKMIEELIHERMQRSNEAISDISSKWGDAQIIDGPILTIPLIDGKNYYHTYCKDLKIISKVMPRKRSRGIFSAVLYSTEIKLDGTFKIPQAGEIHLKEGDFDYSKAILSFGVSDTSGISENVVIELGDEKKNAHPGLPLETGLESGFHIPLELDPLDNELKISTNLAINGSEELDFIPSGNNTELILSSTWKDPSFKGSFLPNEREVSEKGFTAIWKVHELQRNIKPSWFGTQKKSSKPALGVKLLQVNDVYQRILRVIKYAILFISFTFAAVFISERVSGVTIHPIQYLMTGVASLFFYVFLLSLSEHLSFNSAYGLTSLTITLLIAAYAKAIFSSFKMAYTMGGITSLLYLFLFGTLQLEDYALLMGSWGLLLILAIVMYLTRGINQEEQLVRA